MNGPNTAVENLNTTIQPSVKSQIEIMDTTLRDGEQTQGVSFAPGEKVSIAQALLGRLKVDRIEVASAGVSLGEKDAVRQITTWAKENGYGGQVEILGFVDLNRSADWANEVGCTVVNMLSKGSEKHCVGQLRQTPEQHIERIRETVEYTRKLGIRVNVYLEDWSNGYRDNPDYVYNLVDALTTMDIGHVMLPDTLGVLSPAEVSASITDMVSRFPSIDFDFHPHNDYGLATANVMAAVNAGISGIHCTVNCLGERAGNASLAEVAVVLRDKMGLDLCIDEKHIVDVSQMVESFSGKFVACNAPILGTDVFTQTAGIHADGDKKGNLYVTKLSPERFARKRTYALGKLAGKASLEQNLNELGIKLSDDDQKKVLHRVIELGDKKQQVTPADLPFIIAEVLDTNASAYLQVIDCETSSSMGGDSNVKVTVSLNGVNYSAQGTGNGDFAAFINALDEILESHSKIQRPRLADYQVHIPAGGKTDALTEAVITWEMLDGNQMTTRGVSENQVFAAIAATTKIINTLSFA